jgi:ATP-dependent DNA ligase
MTEALPFSLHPLDPKFVGPKPIEQAPLATIEELQAANKLIIERKRNGHCSYTTVGGTDRAVHIYSTGISHLTEKVPSIVEEIRGLNLPRDTMFAGEMFVDFKGYDDLGKFGGIALSGTENALALQKERRVQLAAFNIIAHKGKSVIHLPYADRLDLLRELFAKRASESIHVVEQLPLTFKAAQEQVLKNRWEGLVVYSKDAGSEFRVDGIKERPPRPDGCWKWKPRSEGDFVVTGWIPSTSKTFMGMVKDFEIAQRDPGTGKLVPWGKVGIGITPAERKKYANNSLYPMVWEVEFERRTPNSRLIGACLKRQRFDKEPKECFSPELTA